MPLSVSRLRAWFAAGAILMIAIVAGMYFYAKWRVSRVVHEIPAKIGLDIQQTAEGFSISKSEFGRTEFTVSASKAVQFKEGGHADLHNVKIVVYGKDSSRFDRIAGDHFEFDPKSGDITGRGRVLIDLEANPEGIKSSDQSPPPTAHTSIHLETDDLVFNKDTGNAVATGKVTFQTPEAIGSAVGVNYVSKTGTMTLHSQVEMTVTHPQKFHLIADHGIITKQPSQVVLDTVHVVREGQKMQSERATFFLRPDNTVERILAEGDVQAEVEGGSDVHTRSDQADLSLTGTRNQLTAAVLTGNVHLETYAGQPAQADAGRATLHFGANQMLEKVHAEENVRLFQNRQAENKVPTKEAEPSSAATATQSSVAKNAAPASAKPAMGPLSGAAQQVEMTAPIMDFLVKNGKQLTFAETSGPPEIVITQPESKQKTVVTAAKFTATFTDQNRLDLLHGAPDARIVSTTPGQPERVSTSPTLDAKFQPDGGISTITQAGGLTYVGGTQKAFAQQGTYTATDEMMTLTGSPRVIDGGMTTTAATIRINRITGDSFAEGNVKSTYSDLKPQPDGGLLASSDPIHVSSRSMTAHRTPPVAIYTGNARLWQNSNIVEAPTLQFNRGDATANTSNQNDRSLVAEGNASQPVKTVVVQIDKDGKVTPVTITSAHLVYTDGDRKMFFEGGVTASGRDSTGAYSKMTSQQMTVFLAARNQAKPATPAQTATPGPGQIEKIIAENNVVFIQPTRRAVGDHLVYTASDDRFDLTGGPPSIFDAERGKITGDSLTFYRHDDRVLVEGRQTSPAVTRTQVAR